MEDISDLLSYGQLAEYYDSDLDGQVATVYNQCARILRKQGWQCEYKFGKTLQASKNIGKTTRTLDVEVSPLNREIAVTRDNSSAAIQFKSAQELAAWLPKNIDEPVSNGGQAGASDSSVGAMATDMDTSAPDVSGF